MSVDQAKEKPYEGAGPIWDRITLYVPWLGLIWFIVFVVPMYHPIFEKLQEKGRLPPLVAILMRFGQLDEAWFYLPTIVIAVGFVVCNETMFRYLSRQANGRLWSTHWSTAMILLLLAVGATGFYALLLPPGGVRAIDQ